LFDTRKLVEDSLAQLTEITHQSVNLQKITRHAFPTGGR
jgi:hypothetical protein